MRQGILKGYRSTNVDVFDMGEDGTIGSIPQTRDGRKPAGHLNPYKKINGATFAAMGGVDTAPADEVSRKYGCGTLLLTAIHDGDFVKLQSVDFGPAGARRLKTTVRTNGAEGVIRVTTGDVNGEIAGYLTVKPDGDEITVCGAELDIPVKGVQDVFFTFSGEGYEILDWIFE